MARPWLKVEPALVKHPKTRALARAWRCHPYQVVGFLVSLWGYCLEYQPDGNVDGCPLDVLDELAAPCLGQALGVVDSVRNALLEAGFIDDNGRLHDWTDYAGGLISRREKDRKRKRLARADATRTSGGRPTLAAVDVPRTSEPRVEKSRVEKSREQQQPPTLDYATRCVIAANTALERLLAGAYRPLVATVEHPTAVAWEQLGIPVELAERVISERTLTYRSTTHNRQPNTLRYYESAIREAWEKQRAEGAPPPETPGDRMRRRAAELERRAPA